VGVGTGVGVDTGVRAGIGVRGGTGVVVCIGTGVEVEMDGAGAGVGVAVWEGAGEDTTVADGRTTGRVGAWSPAGVGVVGLRAILGVTGGSVGDTNPAVGGGDWVWAVVFWDSVVVGSSIRGAAV